jgi:Ca2+-binding EF-hand superfamily protein
MEVEDLSQALRPATAGVRDGELVVEANRGYRGRCKTKTEGEILILHDDGHEEWHRLGEVGVPKALRIPPPPPLLPFASYYTKNFKGSSFLQGLAASVAPPARKSVTMPEEEESPKKARSFAANRALRRSLKTGEIGSIVDKLEAEDQAKAEAEAKAKAEEAVTLFNRIDDNKDGVLSVEEFSSAYEKGMLSPQKAAKARPAPLLPFAEYYGENFRGADIVQGIATVRCSSPASPKARELFRKIDVNKDGIVNIDEFKTAYVKGIVTKSNSRASLSPPPPRSSASSVANSVGSDSAFAALEEKIRQRNERMLREQTESIRKGNQTKLSSSSSAPTLGKADKVSEFEEKVRQRNERCKRENEALLRENRRLKALADSKKQADQIAGENDQLRKELDGKRSGSS